MINFFKVLGSAFVVAIAAFAYVYGRGRRNKNSIVEYAKMDSISYEQLVDELKNLIDGNKDEYFGKNLKVQILSKDVLVKMFDFLQEEGVEINAIEENCIGLILLANNNPIYIKLYSYKTLAQDLIDILPEKGIYEQNIEV